MAVSHLAGFAFRVVEQTGAVHIVEVVHQEVRMGRFRLILCSIVLKAISIKCRFSISRALLTTAIHYLMQ